ncbi:hypothetical protein D3C78_824020 [compost metagenome]
MVRRALEEEAVAAQLHRLARRQAQVAFGAVLAGEHHAQGAEGDAGVGQLHAPVAAGQAGGPLEQALVAGLVEQVAQAGQHHPGGEEAHGQHGPVEVAVEEGGQHAEHQAADQHRAEHAQQPLQRGVLPAHQHADGEHQHEDAHQRQEQGVEVRRADRQLGAGQGVQYQRVEGAEEDHRGDHHQHQVVHQQQGLAGPEGEAHLALHHGRAHREQRQGTAHHQQQEGEDEDAALRVGGEGVYRGQHAGTDQEGAQQAQGEGRDGQQHGPALEHAALFGHRQGVDQRGAHQPGHEGGVFHRVPEPPAAPAQLVVGPPGAEHDADAEEGPGDDGPGPRPARPGRVQAAAEQGGDGEGEGHREAHVAHVEHRRVDDQAEVLQQRVEVVAVGRHVRQQAVERVGSDDQEQQEADADHPHHRQHAGQHLLRQLAGEHRYGEGPAAEDQRPEQQRTLVGAPDGAELVVPGQRAVGVAGHVGHREVIHHEGVGQAAEGERQEGELPPGGRLGQAHPLAVAAPGADQRQARLHQRHAQGENQGQVAEFGNHRFNPLSWGAGHFP